MASPSLIGRPSLLSTNSHSSRRREPSFPSLTRGSSTQATTTPIGAWGSAPSAVTTAGGGAELSSSGLRKKGPSLSLALSQGGELKAGEAIHPLKYNWDVTFQHRSANSGNRGNGKKEEQNKGGKEKETREDWETGRQDLGSFSSIESLHPFLAHLTSPSALPASLNSSATIFTPSLSAEEVPPTSNLISDLNIFRSPVVPTWEDAANVGGGRWVLRLRKGVADRVWEEVIFALVGERLGGEEGTPEANAGSKINGVVLSVRKDEDILSLWCAPSTRPERDAIRDSLRLALEVVLTATAIANLNLDYKPHPSANSALSALGAASPAAHFHSNGHAHAHPAHHHRRTDRDRSVDPDRSDRLAREPSQGGTTRRPAGFSAYASPRAPRDASREPGEAFGERRAELGLARMESGLGRSRPELGERGESTRSTGAAWGRSYA